MHRMPARPSHSGIRLNESPSEKEGKCTFSGATAFAFVNASMKVPPKRKGNIVTRRNDRRLSVPQ